jgi:hypothetical protein
MILSCLSRIKLSLQSYPTTVWNTSTAYKARSTKSAGASSRAVHNSSLLFFIEPLLLAHFSKQDLHAALVGMLFHNSAQCVAGSAIVSVSIS